jgi:hypothetical protein
MSGYALTATVLIRIDAHAGEWVPLADLVRFTGVAEQRVRECAEHLVQRGQLHQATAAGHQFYGVQVEGVPPPSVFSQQP